MPLDDVAQPHQQNYRGRLMGEKMSPPAASAVEGSKFKFMCSYGGKILPKPFDGRLKYVGGTTRIIAVDRNITFQELTKTLAGEMMRGGWVLKYQLIPEEELDGALISVRCDVDLRHMLEEHDRRANRAPARLLRTFLFPSTPLVSTGTLSRCRQDGNLLEQRYIDAVTGIVYDRRSSSSSSRSLSTVVSDPLQQLYVDAINGIERNHVRNPLSTISDPRKRLYIDAINGFACNHSRNSSLDSDPDHEILRPAVRKVRTSPNLRCRGARPQNYQCHQRYQQQQQQQNDAASSRLGAPSKFYAPVGTYCGVELEPGMGDSYGYGSFSPRY